MELITDAMRFALDVYGGLRRKGDGSPMIFHVMEAAAIAATLTDDSEVLAAAVLHDAVEDAGVAPEELSRRFGERVARLVVSETENKYPSLPAAQTWRRRKQETLDRLAAAGDPGVAVLFLSDKVSNLRAFHRLRLCDGEAMWRHFNQTDPAQHLWYYRAIAEGTKALSGSAAWQEYNWLIEQVFDAGAGSVPRGKGGTRT